jgi:mRNA interferase RelE/StbE
MTVEFDKSFEKSLDKIRSKRLYQRIDGIILECEEANSINELQNVKKLSGFRSYYRIRLGDYRLGIEMINENTIRFIIIAHRKEIYRSFPKE